MVYQEIPVCFNYLLSILALFIFKTIIIVLHLNVAYQRILLPTFILLYYLFCK